MTMESIKELKQQWRAEFKRDPPAKASRSFLEGHLAWQRQANEHGGLKRQTKTKLKKLMKQLRAGVELSPEEGSIIKDGTRLVRRYQGKQYEVIVTDQGFVYEGKTYTSLSTIARDITGTSWNGKVFFGVKRR